MKMTMFYLNFISEEESKQNRCAINFVLRKGEQDERKKL